jgi:hypothetical protein
MTKRGENAWSPVEMHMSTERAFAHLWKSFGERGLACPVGSGDDNRESRRPQHAAGDPLERSPRQQCGSRGPTEAMAPRARSRPSPKIGRWCGPAIDGRREFAANVGSESLCELMEESIAIGRRECADVLPLTRTGDSLA